MQLPGTDRGCQGLPGAAGDGLGAAGDGLGAVVPAGRSFTCFLMALL